MQFPVPQFTDIEDRVFGPLTLRQFGIMFLAGVLVFAVFTLTKNTALTVITGIIFGFPAAAVVFGKLNGRPIYFALPALMHILLDGAQVYTFQKQAVTLKKAEVEVQVAKALPMNRQDTGVKLRELNYVLSQKADQQSQIADRVRTAYNMK